MGVWLRNNFLTLSCTAVFFAVLGAGFFYLRNLGQPRVSPYNQLTVKRGEIRVRANFSGFIEPKRSTWITSRFDGYVRKLFVKLGDVVVANQPLVLISQDPTSSTEGLFPLKAPFAGQIVDLVVNEQEALSMSQANANGKPKNQILRLDDRSEMMVSAAVSELDYPKLRVGQEVEVRLTAMPQKVYLGKITFLTLSSLERSNWEKSKVEFQLKATLKDKDEALKAGMTAVLDVAVAQVADVLVVGHEYLLKEQGKYFVTTVQGEKREVQVGLQNNTEVEIKSGLREGDTLQANDFLR